MRSMNDSMPKHVAELAIKALNEVGKVIKDSKILIMGMTFKENVEDTRETPVKEIIKELKEFKCTLYGFDPLLSREEINSFGVEALDELHDAKVDCVIITVVHDTFRNIELNKIKETMNEKPILIDVRGVFKKKAENNGFIYRRL